MAKLQDRILAEWRKKYPDISVVNKLKSGKEADLWLVRIKGELLALKVYVDTALSTRAQYTQGQWINSPSLRKAVKQKTKVGKDLQQRLWTKREYYLLNKLHKEGAIVPEVFAFTDTAILMQYLGNEQAAAPRLIDVALDDTIKPQVLDTIEASMKLFLDNGIVHADLSPYNILWWNEQPWVIDFPQAADIRHNSNWQELYERDIRNVRKYFED
jgi:RIO kinase 1